MSVTLTEQDARQSMQSHVASKGAEICGLYGSHPGWETLLKLLQDSRFVRYPCEIQFDAAPLLPGEFAHPVPKGERPEEGFTLCVHPRFEHRKSEAVPLVLYQLVLVNYGEFASIEDAEIFGAAAYGLPREVYYTWICQLADELGDPVAKPHCGGGCCG